MSLKRDAVWTAVDTFATAGLAFLFRLLVARVLSPHDFGLAAIALAVVSMLQVVNDFGLTAALIQKDESKVTPELINTTFTASLIVSVLLALITATIVAPLAADFYREPMVSPLLTLLAVSLLPSPFTTVASALLYRQRRYREVAMNRCITTIGSLGVGAAILWLQPSPWVVVWQAIVGGVLSTIGLTYIAKWRFRLILKTFHLREIFGFSAFVLGGDLIGMFQANAGVFVLGRVLTASEVGLFSLAIFLTDTVRRSLMSILNRVTFVHYSQNQNRKDQLRQAYTSTIIWNCRMLFPVMTAMALFGPPLAIRFLGPEWQNLGPVVRWLSIGVMIHALGGSVSTLYKGIGKPGTDLALLSSTTLLLLFPGLLIGAYLHGLEGAAIATAIVKLLTLILRQILLGRMIGNTTHRIAAYVLRSAALVMPLVLLWLGGHFLWPDHPPEIDALLALIGLAIYGVIEVPHAFPNVAKRFGILRPFAPRDAGL